MLLAIDTATRYASAALYDENGLIEEQSWRSQNNHSREMLPAIDAMFRRQQLTPHHLSAVAVAKGPGSFTGLRIGMSIAKGLCLALDLPIIAVPTLDVIAYSVGDPGGTILAVLEAGRGRLCVGGYRFAEGLPTCVAEIELVETETWQPKVTEPTLLVGEIPMMLADRLLREDREGLLSIATPAGSVRRAGFLAELAWERWRQGQVDDLDTLSPIYLQQPIAGSSEPAGE